MSGLAVGWLLAGLRLGPALVLAPPLGWWGLPLALRVAVAAVLALYAAPLVAGAGASAASMTGGALVGEVGVGLWLGLIVSLPFLALRVAGAAADVAGPVAEPGQGPWSQAVYLVGAAAVVAVRGHVWLLAGLAGSYRAWPVGGAGVLAAGLPALERAATEMLGAGLVMALPLLAFAGLAQVATALAGRAGLGAGVGALPVRPVVVALGLAAMVPLVGATMSHELRAVLTFLATGGVGAT